MSKHLARAIALLLCTYCGGARAETAPVVLPDVDVVTDNEFFLGADATVYARVSGATGLTDSHPLEGAEVTVSLLSRARSDGPASERERELGRAPTGADGSAMVRFLMPRDVPVGQHTLRVQAQSTHGRTGHDLPVQVTDVDMVHVRTDRGIYRPGHVLRWRATAINRANAHPVLGAQVRVVIKDSSETAIWSGVETTDATGMLAGAVLLDRDIALGEYTVSASLEGRAQARVSSTTVRIKPYSLPAFTVELTLAEQGPFTPGDTVRGHVVARYLHGEPVSGLARLAAIGAELADGRARLDAHGRMAFTVTLDKQAQNPMIRARVTDGASRTHEGEVAVRLIARELRIAVIPERPELIPGVRQWLTVITTDGRDQLVAAEIEVQTGGAGPIRDADSASGPDASDIRSSSGAVRIPITPASGSSGRLIVKVRARHRELRAEQDLAVNLGGSPDRMIRVRQAVVPGGDAIEVSGTWKRARGPVVATLLRQGAPVASTPARISSSGALIAHLQPPAGVFGLATVRVTEADWDRATGGLSPRHQQATVYLRPTVLDVDIAGATRYRPGQTATLGIAVRDRAGQALEGVGLAASVVDERALARAEPGPDLVTALQELETGDAKAAGLAFAHLLSAPATQARNLALRAMVEALPSDTAAPALQIAAAARIRAERARMDRVRERVYRTLLTDGRRIGKKRADGWKFVASLDRILARGGWSPKKRTTPWGAGLDWQYARRLSPSLTFADMAPELAEERLQRLARALARNERAFLRNRSLRKLAAMGTIPRYTVRDPWGRSVKLVRGYISEEGGKPEKNILSRRMYSAISAGPDGRFWTADDIVRGDLLNEYGWIISGVSHAYALPGAVGRAIGAPSRATLGVPRLSRDEVAVRRRFDQTVLWETGLMTNKDGRYTLKVPLADSITGWRVDVTALGPRGAVGQARARLETALPTFLDIELPHELTVGDQYQLPVIVANHARRRQTLTLQARVSGSLRAVPAGPAKGHSVTLPSGTTAMVAIPVRARSVGPGTIALTLRDANGQMVDAAHYPLDVQAPGRLERAIYTAESSGQELRLGFTVPDSYTPGSMRGQLSLYRGVVDQAIEGLDGLLREPHGCFEQTSSTTYPNLLVLRLLGEESGGDPDEKRTIRERARELVGKGYQRLISYEVNGGGFSWFGAAPANQVLTAYGLLEFVDMSAVYPVDAELIARTRAWLLEQQKSDGSWAPDKSWLHDWSAVQGAASTTAYIAWALAESGYRGASLARAFGFLRRHRADLQADPYLLSLWAAAESAHDSGHRNPAVSAVLQKVRRDGDSAHVPAGARTLFYASGAGADIQVTALASTALARAPGRPAVAETLAWLWRARDEKGGWGTTQGTVLALRAYAVGARRRAATGRIRVRLGSRTLGELDLGADALPALALPSDVPSGRHELIVEPAVGEGAVDLAGLRADLRTRWRTGPARQPLASGLRVTAQDPGRAVRVGDNLAMRVRVDNPGNDVVPVPMVVIPVPPGFRVVASSLEGLQRLDTVDRATDQGSEIHVYLSRLDGGKHIDLDYRLEATAACRVTQRSAHGYAYYDPDTRGASAELRLRVRPRAKTEID